MEYKAAPDGGAPARYLFRTRVLPGCGWKLVTVVRSSLLTQGMNRIGVLLGLVILALLGLFVLFSRYFLNGIVEPVHAVAEGMEQLVNNDLNVQVKPMGQPEIRNLMESFNQMVLSLKNMLDVNEEAQRRKHRAEIQALQSQINPHFIVNTLNSAGQRLRHDAGTDHADPAWAHPGRRRQYQHRTGKCAGPHPPELWRKSEDGN